MISFLIKMPIYFIISFLILSTPLNKRTLFYHLDEWTSPYLLQFHKKVKSAIKDTYAVSADFTHKLFKPNVPSPYESDQLSHQKSSIEKVPWEEDYTPEERESLKEIIESQQDK